MKKFITGKWFPLLVAFTLLILVAGVVLIMILFGWRFTFAPELENSWGAISSIASWVSVFVALLSAGASFFAVYVAIQIPQKVAEKQNKIALFEKRITCYQEIEKLFNIASAIKQETDIDRIKKIIMALYCFDASKTDVPQMFHPAEYKYTISICTQVPFLFRNINSNDATDLAKAFGKMTIALFRDDKKVAFQEISLYVQTMETFKSRYLEEMKNALSISD